MSTHIKNDTNIKMDNFEINIPDKSFKKDFTIIYKGREEQKGHILEPIIEIKTSKEEFLRKLQYFKNKNSIGFQKTFEKISFFHFLL